MPRKGKEKGWPAKGQKGKKDARKQVSNGLLIVKKRSTLNTLGWARLTFSEGLSFARFSSPLCFPRCHGVLQRIPPALGDGPTTTTTTIFELISQQLRFGVSREGVFQKMLALEGQFLKEISVRFAGENHLRTQKNTKQSSAQRFLNDPFPKTPFFVQLLKILAGPHFSISGCPWMLHQMPLLHTGKQRKDRDSSSDVSSGAVLMRHQRQNCFCNIIVVMGRSLDSPENRIMTKCRKMFEKCPKSV